MRRGFSFEASSIGDSLYRSNRYAPSTKPSANAWADSSNSLPTCGSVLAAVANLAAYRAALKLAFLTSVAPAPFFGPMPTNSRLFDLRRPSDGTCNVSPGFPLNRWSSRVRARSARMARCTSDTPGPGSLSWNTGRMTRSTAASAGESEDSSNVGTRIPP